MAGELPLSGRRALVTGAGRGLGRQIALALAAAGAQVACAARTESEVQETARLCAGGSIGVVMDVSDPEQVEQGVRRAESALGGIDVLVNNAGTAVSQPFRELDLSTWRRVMAVDLDGPFLVTRAALPGMLTRDFGRVIMIGSVLAKVGQPYVAAYTAAKHGLLGLTRALAAEYRKTSVTFNCVCPAYAATPMTEATIDNIVRVTGRSREEARRALLTPQGRLIDPEEVAAACLYLASPLAQSVTGQSLMLDGGATQA